MSVRHEGTTLIKENRSLRSLALAGVALLAPLFTLGFAVGRLTAPVVIASAPAPEAPAPLAQAKHSKPAKAKKSAIPVTPVAQETN